MGKAKYKLNNAVRKLEIEDETATSISKRKRTNQILLTKTTHHNQTFKKKT